MDHGTAAPSARARFQSGLLAWLRQPDDSAGLREMIAVLRELSVGDAGSGAGVLWRSAEAFLASLLEGRVQSDERVRHLCRRIERHLAAIARGEPRDEAELRRELFAFVSGDRSEVPAAETQLTEPSLLRGLQKAMGNSLARTAELLPLIAGAAPPRHPPEVVEAWLAAARNLDASWHAFSRRQADDCRAPATALVAAALRVNTAPSLRLAEALAEACAFAEEAAVRDHPVLRAAIAAALEIAGEREGPNHAHFGDRARHAEGRLAKALAEAQAALPGARPETA